MKNNSNICLVKFLAGLLASVGIGVIISQQVDIVSSPLTLLVTLLTIVSGIFSTKMLSKVAPRRDAPSRLGTFAVILFLAAYVVTGKMLWDIGTWPYLLSYLVAGGVFVWMVFTSVAEVYLLYAICMGGFFSGFVGVLLVATIDTPFISLFSRVTMPTEKAMIFKSIALICALTGAFAAIAGRLSGLGLAENQIQQTWTFNKEGRLEVRYD